MCGGTGLCQRRDEISKLKHWVVRPKGKGTEMAISKADRLGEGEGMETSMTRAARPGKGCIRGPMDKRREAWWMGGNQDLRRSGTGVVG